MRAATRLPKGTVLHIESPVFFSELDEELFFIGLRLVGSVRSYRGTGRVLELRLDARRSLHDDKDLSALLERYRARIVNSKEA